MGRRPTRWFNLPLGVRARKQRSGKIYYYFDTGGTPRTEIPLGSDYPMAIKKWAELEMAVQQPAPHDWMTFRYVAERYIREVIPTKAARTQQDNLKELEQLLAFFDKPPVPIDVIQPVHIRQYLDRRKSAPIRANREKALFSHLWNKAREWGFTDKPNPCTGIKGFKEAGRDHYVEDDAYQAVWNAADQVTRDAIDLAYLTGQRPADVLKLRSVDVRDGFLHFTQNKTKKKLRISEVGELAHVIRRIRSRKMVGIALLYTEKGKPLLKDALRYRFDKARRHAVQTVIEEGQKLGTPEARVRAAELAESIRRYQFRDLRAKAGTDKAEAAGDIREAQKQLGHSSLIMTEHYVRGRRGDTVKPTK
jgi:integrase